MEAVDEKAHRISVENEDPTDMLASQQALELRKFFEPFDPSRPDDFDYGHINPAINKDGALDAYTENIVWRLGGVRAMVTVQDRKIQYFLAGTTRRPGSDHVEIESEDAWFGCKTTDIHDGLWEHTAQINTLEADYPCFIVPDLSKDQRFASMQMVDGSVSSYRFYAGAPITTPQGVNIGTVFMFDNEPRPGGLSSRQRKSLHDAAGHVMKHLETVRDAAERRRVVLMSKGIATFLERTAGVVEEASLHGPRLPVAPRTAVPDPKAFPIDPPAPSNQLQESRKSVSSPGTADGESESILAKIKLTLEHAAEILKDSLELSAGGVVFVDTSSSHSEAGPRDAYFDIDTDIGAELEETKGSGDLELKLEAEKELNVSEEKISQPKSRFSGCVLNGRSPPAKVLSICSAAVAKMEPGAEVLDGKTLQTLINVYPNGNVWYIDQSGYFSSLEQLNVFHESEQTKSKRETSGTSPSFDVIRQRAEANLLSKTFQKARQIIFLPLWDARGNRWHSACFIWSQSAVPVFTVDSEIAYLSAFTNSVMVEISRLDSLIANKMKSDFISSISHEFRSPLHGILASAKFLRESELDYNQREYTTTIQSCGSILLDTINHVLDYSKINSFENINGEKGSTSNGLYQVSNIALLCEEVVDGMTAASEFEAHGGALTSSSERQPSQTQSVSQSPAVRPVEIILDFESRDWRFRVQPGALRRIIMNIFGNAKKYTSAGFIQVRLRIEDDRKKKSESPKAEESSHRMLAMSIIDTGCGISREYMDRKLYTPFAQEDSFAPGVGLGLSIVYSIIIQLGGTISIRSDVGRGTDVEILVPVQDASSSDESLATLPDPHDTTSSDSEQCLGAARKIASGKTIALFRRKTIGRGEPNVFLTWKHVEEYCSSWLGFKIITTQDQTSASSADLVILEKKEKDSADLEHTFSTRVLILRQGIPSAKERDSQQAHGHMANIWNPIGPFKLARIMVALFQEAALSPESRTPLFRSLSDGVGQGAGLPSSLYSRTSSKVNLEDLVTGAAKPLRGDLKVTSDSAFVVAEPDVPGGPSRKPTADKIDQLAQNTQSLSIQVPSQTLSTQPDLTPLRLLAIDDNKLNLDLLCRYLSKRKVDTITRAVNGIEAVNTVKDSSECFDVIFMDISMPEMDGFEATRAIRRYERSARQELAHRPDATTNGRPKHLFGRSYIVALTGLASRRDRDAAIDSGLDEFWTKPFNFGKIGELLRRVSREKEKKWRLDNGPG